MKKVAAFAILLIVLAAPAWAGWGEAVAAYTRGDYATALREWRSLADQGNAAAQTLLGTMYGTGKGAPQDNAEAVKWYRKAAVQGDALAQFNLATMYANGQGVPRDDTQAAKWYRKAAVQSFAAAQNNLGNMYATGQGVHQDYAEATRWFRKAAEQGVATAQNNLGNMYATGRGVPQDYAEAAKWYRKAAEQGVATAQNNLGNMYATGQGIPQDYVQAHMWFNLAAARGDAFATKNRDLVAQRMTPAQIAEAQRLARAWRPRKPAAAAPSRPDAGVATDNHRRIARIQRGLASLGYDPGPADGILGPKTRAAVRAFQAREGLPVTGAASAGLEAALGSASGAAANAPSPAPAAQFDPSQPFTIEKAPRALEKVSTGSGFYVSAQGHVLTNEHVVNGCGEVRIAPALTAAVAAQDEASDLALLKIPADKAGATAKFRQGRGIRPGDDIIVVGYPLRGLLASGTNVTTGTVSALAGPGDDRRLIQITAPVQPGNSGGPVLDAAGNAVGVVVAKLNAIRIARATGDIPQNVNFAVSAGTVRAFLDARGVPYETAPSTGKLEPADIAAKARRFTVLVECWK